MVTRRRKTVQSTPAPSPLARELAAAKFRDAIDEIRLRRCSLTFVSCEPGGNRFSVTYDPNDSESVARAEDTFSRMLQFHDVQKGRTRS